MAEIGLLDSLDRIQYIVVQVVSTLLLILGGITILNALLGLDNILSQDFTVGIVTFLTGFGMQIFLRAISEDGKL